jgi:hypothetical protein
MSRRDATIPSWKLPIRIVPTHSVTGDVAARHDEIAGEIDW